MIIILLQHEIKDFNMDHGDIQMFVTHVRLERCHWHAGGQHLTGKSVSAMAGVHRNATFFAIVVEPPLHTASGDGSTLLVNTQPVV